MKNEEKYVVIFQDDITTYCKGIFDNFYTALGYIYKKFNEQIKFNIKDYYVLTYKNEFVELEGDVGYMWKTHYKSKDSDYEFDECFYLLENLEEDKLEENNE